jgi:aminoglycoside/choline kinase family phosphotransferase
MDSARDPSLTKFVAIATKLAAAGVAAPRILASDLNQKFLLLEDFGDNLYLNVINDINCDAMYGSALQALVQMQLNFQDAHTTLEHFNYDFIIKQMEVFKTWFVETHLQRQLPDSDTQIIVNFARWYANFVQQQPLSFVHLDYHSRNLLLLPTATTANLPDSATTGILDFQDAMFGPTVYDLVSLFQDAYISWDPSKVATWLKSYQNLTQPHQQLAYKNFAALMTAFNIVGLQRHLKNLGVFARLMHRDQKPNYLQHIPQLLSYIHATLKQYDFPEVVAIGGLLRKLGVVG